MKKPMRAVALAVLALLLLGPIPDSLARPGPARPAAPSGPAVKALDHVGPDTSAAYGTGTVVHADALSSGEKALLGLDVAFSGAAYSSAGDGGAITNEVQRLVSRKLAANAGFGRGTGLEVGLGSDPIPLLGQLSQAAAPPSTDLVHKVIGPIGVPGVLTAELLRSQAQARAADGCVLGRDQAYGLGSVLDLEVLGGLISTVARPPRREVSQSTSTSRIVPGSTPGRLGLKSETRQTIAPVTLFKGTPIQFTVEVLGEWALRATADGAEGKVHYGPLEETPETPVVRVLDAQGTVLGQLTTQDLLGDDGLEITIPGVAEIVIGEDPRMIGGDASSAAVVKPTEVAAAVDVVRIKLLNGQAADVRVGHMEAAVNVPAGGVQCPGLEVDQTVDPVSVTPGQEFEYTITITNPHDCALGDVKLVDTITATPGVTFELVSSTPSGGDLAGGVVTYDDLSPLGPGETKTVKVTVKIPADSAAGTLTSNAVVTGVCPDEQLPATDIDGPGSDPAHDIPVRGEDTLVGPTVGVCIVPDLDGKTLAEAKTLIEAAGCTVGEVTDGGPPADPDDLGKVVGQDPAPETSVPIGTPVDITIGGPLCTVPSVSGLTPDEARTKLRDAGCELGDVTTGPDGPGDPGTITTQTPPAGDKVPTGTEVDVTVVPATCVVPDVTGMTEAEAKAALEAAGCLLGDVDPGPGAPDPAGVGKVVDQGTPVGTSVPRGTEVDITVAGPVGTDLDAQVLGETVTKADNGGTGTGTGSGVGPGTLARTGGVALAGLALWLLASGLLTSAAGSARTARLLRRRRP